MSDLDRLAKGDLLLERERTTEARQLFAEGLQINPDDTELLMRLGRCEIIDGDLHAGREQLEAALATDPHHAPSKYVLASVYLDLQEYQQAEALLIDLLHEDPTDADTLALYSRVMLLSLQFDKAKRLAEESLRQEPQNPNGLRAVALVAIVDGNRERRAAALQELLSEHPDDESVTRLVLYSLAQEGRNREAYDLAQGLLRHEPDDADLVDLVIELRTLTHPASWPCYPFVRWGWPGSIVLWGAFVLGLPILRRTSPALAGPVAIGYLGLVFYSWLYQPVLKRYLRWKGV